MGRERKRGRVRVIREVEKSKGGKVERSKGRKVQYGDGRWKMGNGDREMRFRIW